MSGPPQSTPALPSVAADATLASRGLAIGAPFSSLPFSFPSPFSPSWSSPSLRRIEASADPVAKGDKGSLDRRGDSNF